jgi:hypothetical protein
MLVEDDAGWFERGAPRRMHVGEHKREGIVVVLSLEGGCLFRRHRWQRTGWWWTRARREVLCRHVGLVADDGHC